MSTTRNAKQYTPQVLNVWHVQLITAQGRIKLLEETLEAVREDLELRADVGTPDGIHVVELSCSVYAKLCDVTDRYGKYETRKDAPPTLWQRLLKLSHSVVRRR